MLKRGSHDLHVDTEDGHIIIEGTHTWMEVVDSLSPTSARVNGVIKDHWYASEIVEMASTSPITGTSVSKMSGRRFKNLLIPKTCSTPRIFWAACQALNENFNYVLQ